MFSLAGLPPLVAILTLILVCRAVFQRWLKSGSTLPLPPGPPGNWLLGNILPKNNSYLKNEEWTQQCGPVFSLKGWFQTTIIIGRLEAAIDIMEKEGVSLADRPRNIPGEALSGGMRLLLTPAGDRCKKMRRALHVFLQPKMVEKYESVFMGRAKQHILGILDSPEKHEGHARYYAASVVMELTYGIIPKRHDDPDVASVNACLRRLGENLIPGKWKVNTLPFMKYIPGYLKELHDGHAEELALFKRKLFEVKDKVAKGVEVPNSFGRYLLEKQKVLGLSDDEAAYLAGSLFGAGSETTASSISVSIMAAACYPEAQRRVQEELDRIVGLDRAPTIADLENLPQLHAFVLEVFRWRPVGADGFGFAHKSTRDIVWKSYIIPKDSTVIGSVWSIGRDPEYFPNPDQFDPQRWMTADGTVREDLKNFVFGFGRRVCPGQHVAKASVLLNTALLQWAFDIKQDPSSPINAMNFTNSALTRPHPFSAIFEPRAARTADGIRELLENYAI
jgi:cytochrome P450